MSEVENPEMQEQREVSEEPVQESEVMESEAAVSEPEDESLPFAKAEIYRLLRKSVGDNKIIRASVKEEMNLFLGRVAEKIGEKLSESKYTTIELADFRKAAKPYEEIDDLVYERERILTYLDKIKQDCDSLGRDVRKKFGPEDTREVDATDKMNVD